VFWDVQDVMLEDVERIEVVSGAGGTFWGTNAVNGVINLITRSAEDTQGGLVVDGGGNTEAGTHPPSAGGVDICGGSALFRVPPWVEASTTSASASRGRCIELSSRGTPAACPSGFACIVCNPFFRGHALHQ
jgi:iron complex outermembrane receptor protein